MRDVHAGREPVDFRLAPSKAMRRVLDEGRHPRPASFADLAKIWTPQGQGWTGDWLRQLGQLPLCPSPAKWPGSAGRN